MDSLKIPKAITGSGSSKPAASPKSQPSGVPIPISVRFNAGDERIENIYQPYQNNNGSPLDGSGDGPHIRGASSGAESLSSSPHQQQMQQQQQRTNQTNPDDINARNSFLQGNFFNRKSVGSLSTHGQKSPQQQQQQQLQQQPQQQQQHPLSQRVSPNTPRYLADMNGFNSATSPIVIGSGGGGGGGNGGLSPSYNGVAGGNSGPVTPNGSGTMSSLKYRRSISLTGGKMGGTSPTSPGYSMDSMAQAQAGLAAMTLGNGAPDSGYMANYCNGGVAGLRPPVMDGCLKNIVRQINAGGSTSSMSGGSTASSNGSCSSTGGGDNMAAAAAVVLAERMRQQKVNEQQISEAEAVALLNGAGGNGNGSGSNPYKLSSSPSHHAAAMVAAAVQAVGGGLVGPTTNGDHVARYSRKVFVGGLPPDIDEDEITSSFRRFGALVVDWPHKAESKSYFPPKGYAFLLFQDENSVQQLIDACITDDDKLYLCVSSPTIKDKPVQIRPWRLGDADYVLDASMPLDPRKTVFVGGVPRPLKAFELAMIMDRLYGGVCYAGIDTDPELKYPKGAGRVAFSNQQSYIAAISARFVQLLHGDIDKRVEVKPYVLDDQMCDECEGQRCHGKFAPFFCANITCLQYYCEHCWTVIHSRPGREYHKPLVKEGADRPRAVPFRWC